MASLLLIGGYMLMGDSLAAARARRFEDGTAARLTESIEAASHHGVAAKQRAQGLAVEMRRCLDRMERSGNTRSVNDGLARCLGRVVDAARVGNPSTTADLARFASSIGYPPPRYTQPPSDTPQP